MDSELGTALLLDLWAAAEPLPLPVPASAAGDDVTAAGGQAAQ